MTLPDNFPIVDPDAIILALRAATKRFKKRQRRVADRAANPEYYRAHDQYRYQTGRLLSGSQRRKLHAGRI